MSQHFDAIVVGAGAAGLLCAARIGQGGLRVALLDHSEKLAEKIRISGGGRCNFTNRVVTPDNFVSQNPRFARHALANFKPDDFIAMVRGHRIAFHEKHKGQLFCDRSSEDIIEMLVSECQGGKVQWYRPHSVSAIEHSEGRFTLQTTAGRLTTAKLVIATGGLPVPKIGATDFGLRIARQFGHKIIEPRPALVPMTFDSAVWEPYASLAGVALPVKSRGSEPTAPWFDEDLLFTHRGLSGPAVLQASSYWQPGQALHVNFSGYKSPELCLEAFKQAAVGTRAQFENWLAQQLPHVPRRLLESWLVLPQFAELRGRKVAEFGKKQLQPLVQALAGFGVVPSGTEGYRKAEVMRGGVDTAFLNPKKMESTLLPGLFFIGEVVDVTGWLGGYNFQWAWASGVLAAQAILKTNA